MFEGLEGAGLRAFMSEVSRGFAHVVFAPPFYPLVSRRIHEIRTLTMRMWTPQPNLIYQNYNRNSSPELAEYSFVNVKTANAFVSDSPVSNYGYDASAEREEDREREREERREKEKAREESRKGERR